jgi:hypothetical protein
MDSNSPLFDKIRIKPRSKAAEPKVEVRCEHPGCEKLAGHRAPKGRGQEGQFWNFCVEHVRAYNATYNYFAGMQDEAIATYQKDAQTGHRPTWSVSANAAGRTVPGGKATRRKAEAGVNYDDPLGVFGKVHGAAARAAPAAEPRRTISARALLALDTMGLDETADAVTIKARYKALVKRFHPDANGGDRSYEARLQDIIKAYEAVKASGLVRN